MDNSATNAKGSITEHFKCNKCQDYLTPPISFCLEGHIICKQCANENVCPQCGNELSTKLNQFIGCFAKNLKIPCKNIKNGCPHVYKWNEEFDHLKKCDFSTFKCPLSIQTDCDVSERVNCEWEGTLIDMKKHIIEETHNGLIKSDGKNCMVLFDVNLSKKNCCIYPILVVDQLYLIHLKHTPEEIAISVNYVGIFENADNYEVELKINNCDNSLALTYKLECKHLSNNDTNYVKVIPNSVLEFFNNEDSILNCSLKPIALNSILKSCDSILIEAECPVCSEYMVSHIYVCQTGHSICESCKSRVTYCPICHSILGIIRNYKLESLISKLQFPCAFKSKGCTDLLTATQLKEHEAACSFEKYRCPITPCIWEGTQNEMLVHAKEIHYSWLTNKLNMTITLLTDWETTEIANVQEKPFICHYVRNVEENLFCIAVQTYENNASDYYYTFEIGNRENKFISVHEVCTNYKEPISEVINKKCCIVLNMDYVMKFSDYEGILFCSGRIEKNNNA